MSKELNLPKELVPFQQMLENSPDGEYLIPHLWTLMAPNEELRMFNRLMHELVRAYPEYQFSTHEDLHLRQKGILVRWRKRK